MYSFIGASSPGIVVVYVMATGLVITCIVNFRTWWAFQYHGAIQKLWLRILSIDSEKELKVLDNA